MLALAAWAGGVGGVGCVSRKPSRPAPRTALGIPDRIDAIVRQALALDATADRAADTLYAPDALVVANARVRLAPPRFAGIGYGGRVTVAAVTVTLEGRFAWVLVDYRWYNLAQNQAEAGRASFICSQTAGGWRIVHAHSSQLLPWDH